MAAKTNEELCIEVGKRVSRWINSMCGPSEEKVYGEGEYAQLEVIADVRHGWSRFVTMATTEQDDGGWGYAWVEIGSTGEVEGITWSFDGGMSIVE